MKTINYTRYFCANDVNSDAGICQCCWDNPAEEFDRAGFSPTRLTAYGRDDIGICYLCGERCKD